MANLLDESGAALLDEGGGFLADELGPDVAVTQQQNSWWGLDAVFKQSRAEFEAYVSRPPVACPVCGEPLTNGPATPSGSGVELYCKFGHGWQYPRDWIAPQRPGF